MKDPIALALSQLNCAHRKLNGVYHRYAKAVRLSDTALWILYSLYEHGAPCTQKDLCDAWFYAPQTINTALKSLEEKGFVSLVLAPNSQKNKQIFLTEAGESLVREKISPMVQAEKRSFARLDAREQTQLLELTQKHIALVKEEFDKLIKKSSEDKSSQ